MDSSFEIEELDDLDFAQIEEEISSLYEEIKGAVCEDELSNSCEEPNVNVVDDETRSHKVSENSPPETSVIDNLQDSPSRNENTELRKRVVNKKEEFVDVSLVPLKYINVENTSLRERIKSDKEISIEDSLTSKIKDNTSFKGVISKEEELSVNNSQIESRERKGGESKKEEKVFDQNFSASLINKTNFQLDNGLNLRSHETQLADTGGGSGKTIDANQISTDCEDHPIVYRILSKSKKIFAKVPNQEEFSVDKKVNVILKMLRKLFVTHMLYSTLSKRCQTLSLLDFIAVKSD